MAIIRVRKCRHILSFFFRKIVEEKVSRGFRTLKVFNYGKNDTKLSSRHYFEFSKEIKFTTKTFICFAHLITRIKGEE